MKDLKLTCMRYLTSALSMVIASSGQLMSRDEALFWLSVAITVLQAIYDFYKWYTDPDRIKKVKDLASKPE